jgi:hypothetical protein
MRHLNVTAQRLKLWREGRGAARYMKLDFIELYGKVFLYNIDDIENIIRETDRIKDYNIKNGLYIGSYKNNTHK